MSTVGRPKGNAGYLAGELEVAISVCLYHNFEGLTVAEIARRTGGHPASVRAALKRLLAAKQVYRHGHYRARWTVKA